MFILIAVYLLLSIPAFVLLWAALVVAKDADDKRDDDNSQTIPCLPALSMSGLQELNFEVE